MKHFACLGILFLMISTSFAETLSTDRPDFTEGTHTILPGRAQFELGYTYSDSPWSHTAPELLSRIGLIKDLELRLAWGGYFHDAEQEGTTDGSIGFKHRMYEQLDWRPELSFIGEVGVPVGSAGSDEVEFAGKLLWAYEFESLALGGNFNLGAPIGEEGRYGEFASSLALGVPLTSALSCFGEYFGLFPIENVPETAEQFLNGGLTYVLNPDLQFDIRAGFGLNDAAGDFFSGVGLSVRI